MTNILAKERREAREAEKAAAQPEYHLSEDQWTYFMELAQQKMAIEAVIVSAIRAAGLPPTANVDITNRTIMVPE